MRKIKWGVLGTAYIAETQTIPGMHMAANAELTAIAGRDINKAERFKNELGFKKAYGSYEALLRDEEIEAVYIPLANQLHKEWTIKALKAGKHVLCEKPMAMNPEDLKEMYAEADRCNKLLMEAYAYLHSPFTKAVKDEIKSGAIGDILYMESAFITSNYSDGNFRMHKESYGGAQYDLGCYNVSQIMWMLDEEPEYISASVRMSGDGIDILTTGILGFAGNRSCTFTCGMVLDTDNHKRIDRFQIHGTRGFIRSSARFNSEGDNVYEIESNGVVTRKTVKAPHNYMLEVERFGNCILEGKEMLVTREWSERICRVQDKILKEIDY